MNVYDFDKTIYNGDSTVDFYLFCLKKKPKIVFYLFKQLHGLILYMLKKITKTEMKEYFFSFVSALPIDKYVSFFWDINKSKIKDWYLKQKNTDDIIITASPEFLITPICQKLGINVIASKVDSKKGKFIGLNCYGEEKVSRYKNKYGNEKIDKFYSDSLSDLPLAKISREAFLVKKNIIKKWIV